MSKVRLTNLLGPNKLFLVVECLRLRLLNKTPSCLCMNMKNEFEMLSSISETRFLRRAFLDNLLNQSTTTLV